MGPKLGALPLLLVGIGSMSPKFLHGISWLYKDSRLGPLTRGHGLDCRPGAGQSVGAQQTKTSSKHE